MTQASGEDGSVSVIKEPEEPDVKAVDIEETAKEQKSIEKSVDKTLDSSYSEPWGFIWDNIAIVSVTVLAVSLGIAYVIARRRRL